MRVAKSKKNSSDVKIKVGAAVSRHVSKAMTIVTTVGGSLCFFRGIGEKLQSRHWTVYASSKDDSALDKWASAEGFRATPLDLHRAISPIRDLRAIVSCICSLRKTKPAIVHAHTPKAGLVAMIAAWAVGVPKRLYTVHGLPIETSTGLRAFLLWIADAIALLCATDVYAVSTSVKTSLKQYRLPRALSAKVLGHGTVCGVDVRRRFHYSKDDIRLRRKAVRESFGIPEGAVVAGFVGRFVQDKGIRELVSAARMAQRDAPGLHMLMVGTIDRDGGPDFASISDVQNDSKWSWAGWQPDVEKYYPAMDFLVLPSYREGFPTVVLEAAAMGVPAIVTDATGCVDAVVHRQTGIVVPARDSKTLAEAMVLYADDVEVREKHGRVARERVCSQFSQDFVQALLVEEYERLWESLGSRRCREPREEIKKMSCAAVLPQERSAA
jgi:glycosyltransferase involved in cell wall biosynthesis